MSLYDLTFVSSVFRTSSLWSSLFDLTNLQMRKRRGCICSVIQPIRYYQVVMCVVKKIKQGKETECQRVGRANLDHSNKGWSVVITCEQRCEVRSQALWRLRRSSPSRINGRCRNSEIKCQPCWFPNPVMAADLNILVQLFVCSFVFISLGNI